MLAHAGSRWLTLAHAGSSWLTLVLTDACCPPPPPPPPPPPFPPPTPTSPGGQAYLALHRATCMSAVDMYSMLRTMLLVLLLAQYHPIHAAHSTPLGHTKDTKLRLLASWGLCTRLQLGIADCKVLCVCSLSRFCEISCVCKPFCVLNLLCVCGCCVSANCRVCLCSCSHRRAARASSDAQSHVNAIIAGALGSAHLYSCAFLA